MFTLNENNLAQIKAAAKHYGKIWFHGDGNIYHKKEESDFRKDFSNIPSSGVGTQTYRSEFSADSAFPETVEHLAKILTDSKSREIAQSAVPKDVASIATFSVPNIETQASLVPKIDDHIEL